MLSKAEESKKAAKVVATWSAERVEILVKRWKEGLSAAKIAEELGETITRNAVIGKIFRLGLSNQRRNQQKALEAEETKVEVQDQTTETEPIEPASSAAETEPTELDPATIMALAKQAESTSPKLGVLELTERTCKWPIGDPSKEEFWFCGHPSEPGKPYCLPHNRIAIQPIASKRDRRLQAAQNGSGNQS